MAVKSVALSLVYSRRSGWRPCAASALTNSSAMPCAVVDHGDALRLELPHGVAAQRAADLAVAAHQAERGPVAALRVAGVGGDRELRDAGVGVEAGRRDGHAGVEVADHRPDPGVHQALRHLRAHARVSLVVLGHQLELHRLPAHGDGVGVEFVHRHARGVFVVLAVVRLRPGQRRGKAQLDHGFRLRGGDGQRRHHAAQRQHHAQCVRVFHRCLLFG